MDLTSLHAAHISKTFASSSLWLINQRRPESNFSSTVSDEHS